VSQQTTNHSFDELTRGLASGSISRGRALRLMGAALVGSTLGSLGGVAAADDECKPLERKCRKNHQCCSGNCSKSGTSKSGTCACQENGGTCGSNSQCCSGNCSSGTCAAACKPNFTEESLCVADSECCSGACVHSDPSDPSFGACLPCHCPNETSACLCRNRADVTGTVCIDFSRPSELHTVPSCADCVFFPGSVCYFQSGGGIGCAPTCGP
jgi:hypothetical protein